MSRKLEYLYTGKQGFDSHIRGFHTGYTPHHVFPGKQMAGNEAGTNGPIYSSQPGNYGNTIEIKRRHDGHHPWHKFYRTLY